MNTEILWGAYQEFHITTRHGVTADQFEAPGSTASTLLYASTEPMKAWA